LSSPERHVEVVDLALGHQALCHGANLEELHPKPLRRKAHAKCEVRPADSTHDVDDLEQEAGAFSSEPPYSSRR